MYALTPDERRTAIEQYQDGVWLMEIREKLSKRTLRDIIRDVSEETGVSVAEIIGRARTGRIVKARQAVMYCARREGRFSTTQIGRALHRDHTTVIYGADAYAEKSGLPKAWGGWA
jgi:chromosomal replication initiation ATPase DnaA